MASPRLRAAVAVLVAILSATASLLHAEAQSDGVRLSSDLQLLGINTLSGGGHVTWTLTGDAAKALRQRIVALFDAYAWIPRGLAYAGNATGGNGDGVIQGTEAITYTNFLENELEGIRYGYGGTDVRFIRINRADLLEKSLPVNRSTSGLVGTNANSTEPLEIRFIFNADTVSEDYSFQFSDLRLAHALFKVFDLRQVQTWVNGDPWPLVRESGWHPVLMTDGQWAFWPGNDTTWTTDPRTGRYDNGRASTSRTATEASVLWLDLQTGSSANVTFQYLGQLANLGDSLRLQIATEPSYATWSDLATTDGDTSLPDSPTWRSVTYDLSAYIGQRVRLRLNFTSDASLNDAPGFFVRGFEINAPSVFRGSVESSSTDFLVGLLSFGNFEVRTGRTHVIRTPAGEILLYSASYDSSAPPADTGRFRSFELIENPQFLFGLLLAAAIVNSSTRRRLFARYRKRHPEEYRDGATESRVVKWAARGILILLVLLYFVPSLFAFVGVQSLFVTGVTFLVLVVASTAGLGLGSWAVYRREARFIPPAEAEEIGAEDVPPPPPDLLSPSEAEGLDLRPHRILPCARCLEEIEFREDVHKCLCGQTYHRECAADLGQCPNCRRPLGVVEPLEKKMVAAKCPECGEIQLVPESTDLMRTRCETCGAHLKGIDPGSSYLIVASQPEPTWEWFQSLVRNNVPGLALSSTHPEKLRRQYGLQGVELHWLSEGEQDSAAVDPRRLEPELLLILSNFIRHASGGAVLLDGLERLISGNAIEDVVRFLRKVTDLASVHEVTLLASVAPKALGEEDQAALRREFDRVLEVGGLTANA